MKLTRDADDNPVDFRITTWLTLIASALYLIPQVFGVEAADQAYLGGIPAFLTTSSNQGLAVPVLYISYIVVIATAAYLFLAVTFRGARSPITRRPAADERRAPGAA